jgi:ribosomal protein S14
MMKYLLIKDKKKRNLFCKFEVERLLLKSILFNLNFGKNIRKHIFFSLANNYTKQMSKTQLRNRCILTNRSRFIFTKYKISRLQFKRLINLGRLTGTYRKV